jgi:hypothetical protein
MIPKCEVNYHDRGVPKAPAGPRGEQPPGYALPIVGVFRFHLGVGRMFTPDNK